MKPKLYVSLLLFLFITLSFSQPPQGINYQGVARNTQGLPLINRSITIRLSLLDSSAVGQSVYAETHNTVTNCSGLFNLSIGLGTAVSGTFASIPWGQSDKWLQIEMDTSGGSNFHLIGSSQFMSVPYSLYSKNSGPKGVNIGDMQYWDGSFWVPIPVGNTGEILTLNGNQPAWTSPKINVGDFYKGGIVAYILRPFEPGYDPNILHGLIAATHDQSASAMWGCNGLNISGADALTIGTGAQNTSDIIASCSDLGIASRLCSDLVINGYSDWYLPSKDELDILYLNRGLIGGFFVLDYWSSSEVSYNGAWSQRFVNGIQYQWTKDNTLGVRAVRSF